MDNSIICIYIELSVVSGRLLYIEIYLFLVVYWYWIVFLLLFIIGIGSIICVLYCILFNEEN